MQINININIDDRIIKAVKHFFSRKVTIALALLILAGISIIAYSATITKPHTFTPGNVIFSDDVNENFDTIYTAVNAIKEPPIGTIHAWHKNLYTSPPALPAGWVECNGQVLADAESPFNGKTIPNLNGDVSGADSPGISRKDRMFIRGGTASGSGEDHQFQDHYHKYREYNTNSLVCGFGCGADRMLSDTSTTYPYTSSPGQTPVSGNHGSETRPANMSVVWIIRVK
ncbi:MAG TPA: hypothetical protein PKM65_04115 [Spirochaetota bacterium]|nr:hypothetical protein [Spirochaetota bacterium]HNT10732.1 hypothetical protein [Spirochaetota bacterium]